jgi:hypothetical protein
MSCFVAERLLSALRPQPYAADEPQFHLRVIHRQQIRDPSAAHKRLANFAALPRCGSGCSAGSDRSRPAAPCSVRLSGDTMYARALSPGSVSSCKRIGVGRFQFGKLPVLQDFFDDLMALGGEVSPARPPMYEKSPVLGLSCRPAGPYSLNRTSPTCFGDEATLNCVAPPELMNLLFKNHELLAEIIAHGFFRTSANRRLIPASSISVRSRRSAAARSSSYTADHSLAR